MDFIVRPTNDNSVVGGQVEKMLQAELDTVLSPDLNQAIVERVESAAGHKTPMEDALNDRQMWLSNNLDMDFCTYSKTIRC